MLQGWLQIVVFFAVLTALRAAARRLHGAASTRASACSSPRSLGPVERLLYRVLRVDPSEGQDWKRYARSAARLLRPSRGSRST